jgi:ABC-type uncharacterized transport system involved in gliding motility auxiliary subunit
MKKTPLILLLLALSTAFTIHIIHEKLSGARWDMTQEKLFSLTEGTHQILEKMNTEKVKPVSIKLYFSETSGKMLPQFIKNFINYADYTHNLLKEYERYANGKLNVLRIDPVTDSDAEQAAKDAGLEGKPINQHGDQFFFGLVFETKTGSKDVIPFLWPEKQETLEYDISQALYHLLWPQKKRIAVMSSLEVLSEDNPYYQQMLAMQGKAPTESWAMFQMLQEQAEVTLLDPETDTIAPEEYDLLLLVHPKALSKKQQWAIDEWVVRGGRTLVFVDPYCVQDKPPQNPQNPMAAYNYKPESEFSAFLEQWGLERVADQFAVDYTLAVKRPVAQGGLPKKVLVDLMTSPDNRSQVFNNDSTLFTPGVLKAKENAPGTLTPLVQTTPQGNQLTIEPGFGFGGQAGLHFTDFNQPEKLLQAFSEGSQPVVFAYQIQGKMPSLFPEGVTFSAVTPQRPEGLPPGIELPPEEGAEMVTKEPLSDDLKGEASIIVFADVDFLSDIFAFQKTFLGTMASNDNHKIVLNAVDFLLGAQELMNVRSKASIQRPFERFDAIEAEADLASLSRENELREEIQRFQEEVRNKQSQATTQNASLMQKKLQDDVDALNDKIRLAERELKDIRKAKRQALASEIAWIRFTTLWMMPILVFALGIGLFLRRKSQEKLAKGGGMS